MNNLAVGFGIAVGVIILGAAAVVLFLMATGKIDLKFLVSEQDGSASISRFQLLIFTFVIGLSYFLLVISQVSKGSTTTLPSLPPEVLTLLGISGGSYVLSKGIQKTAEVSSLPTQGTQTTVSSETSKETVQQVSPAAVIKTETTEVK
jgi:hypothetical protein